MFTLQTKNEGQVDSQKDEKTPKHFRRKGASLMFENREEKQQLFKVERLIKKNLTIYKLSYIVEKTKQQIEDC